MKTSWNEQRDIEQYLTGNMLPEERLLFEARVLTNPLLKFSLAVQKKVYTILQHYHRKEMKKHVNEVHLRLLRDPSKKHFNETIQTIFKSV